MGNIIISVVFILLGLLFWFQIGSEDEEENYRGLSGFIVNIFGLKVFQVLAKGVGVIIGLSGVVQLLTYIMN